MAEAVSLVCAIKNRFQMLRVSVPSWTKYENIKEFIIVDWSSDDLDKKALNYFENLDERIKIIKIENQKFFNLSKAYNIGFNYAKEKLVIKMDADYIFNPFFDFFENYQISQSEFLTGTWKSYKVDNGVGFMQYLNGFLFIHKNNFIEVGGYNENLKGYGWDDCDLYQRLEKKGLSRKILNYDKITIYHNPHEDKTRSENYECKNIKLTAYRNRNFYSKRKK